LANSKTYFEHKLLRNGFNFCIGRIGEKNYDFIFVQSVDGAISIYDQDHILNAVTINEVIIPGPITYISSKDFFIVSNTSYEIECYGFNNLASANGKDKKLMPEWTLNIGELVKELKVNVNKQTKKQEILILTESILHLVDENGKLLFQKKLDFEPMAIYSYNITDPNYTPNKFINLMYIISTDQNHLLIYKGTNLSWAIKYFSLIQIT
jgi:Bardet-Biedl syndrome 9 protein